MNRRTRAPLKLLALAACAIGASIAFADDPPAATPESKSQPAEVQPAPNAREAARERLRQAVNRQLQAQQDRLERLRRLKQLLDEGKTIPEVRREFDDLQGLLGEGPGGPGRRREGAGGPEGPQDMQPGRGRERPGDIEDLDRPLPGPNGPDPQGDAMRRGPNNGPGPREQGRNRSDRPQRPDFDDRLDQSEPPAEVGEKELSFVEEFLESSAPRVLERFRELRKRDPEEARRRFVEMFPRVRFLYQMREHDPDMFRLRLQDIRFGREALEAARDVAMFDSKAESGGASAPDREAKVDRLRQWLRRQYQVRTDIMKLDLAKVKAHSDKLAADIEKRSAPDTVDVEKFVQSLIERESNRAHRRRMNDRDPPGDDDRPQPEERP